MIFVKIKSFDNRKNTKTFSNLTNIINYETYRLHPSPKVFDEVHNSKQLILFMIKFVSHIDEGLTELSIGHVEYRIRVWDNAHL